MASIPIVTVVGYSDSGKTRCIVELISILTRKGYRVASAKHCHDGFTLDTEGKDTWKQKRAGAVTTLMSSRTSIGVIADNHDDLSLEQLCRQYVQNVDIVLAEGYSWEKHPKILVTSKQRIEEERVMAGDGIIAFVGESRTDSTIRSFTFAEMEKLAVMLEQLLLSPAIRYQYENP
ncbi:MAG TPA: molybdopterin-guanine dinucleotide biosynthesis protein B [Blastocatellia bacterium]|nr:molybdopterin-guanine dinucleotide biosynthesis protein B [Blastocatellia bacterium]